MFRSAGRSDSGLKFYGSIKADSAGKSGKNIGHAIGHESSVHPSRSCNVVIITVLVRLKRK